MEVKSTLPSGADQRCVNTGVVKAAAALTYWAHCYWAGEPFDSDDPHWEFLLVPPVRVIRRIG